MEHSALIVAGLLVAFAAVSKKLTATVITAPMIFVALGLILGAWTHVLWLPMDHEVIDVLAEVTLVLVLFADASRIDLKGLRKGATPVVRLLALGLPLTIALGAVVAKLIFPTLSWFEAGALGAVLAPTDAALGQAVVSSEMVPLGIRRTLTVESGLNDGIALPAVLIFAALASMEQHTSGYWVQFAALQVTLGPLVGLLVGAGGGWILERAATKGFSEGTMQRIGGLSLAVLAYLLSEFVGGNGFISAFVAGLAYGRVATNSCEGVHRFLESEGQLLMLLVFLMFGASLAWPALLSADLMDWIYIGLSLTVIRMVPVGLSLIGTKMGWRSTLFIGWFGPRGLATILFGLLILSRAELPNGLRLGCVAMTTALASVLLHGLTAAPGVRWLASSHSATSPAEPSAQEAER